MKTKSCHAVFSAAVVTRFCEPGVLFLALVLAAFLISGPVRADQQIQDNLEVTQNLTIRADALLEGAASFGRLASQQTSGFVTDVYQGVSTVEREEIIPDHYESQQVWVDEYGTIDSWIWADDWGWVWREVWVPDQYDEFGNIIAYGYYEQQQFWEIIGGHSELTSSWGVTGGHYESQDVWIPEQRNTYTETIYGIPIVRHTGQRHDVVWSWRNFNPADGSTRELLELSPAGLSIPHPDYADGSARATLTSTSYEQSYTTPVNSNGAAYQSYGMKLSKDKIEGWFDEGYAMANYSDPVNTTYDVVMSTSRTAEYKPEEMVLKNTQPSESPEGPVTTTVTTRIAAASASFGGTVSVNGALLVQPQGDLAMGQYTNGPQP